ncbi:unnamed protein product [Meganyctiphanes norvegica]|uniref:WAP domain-containing protein n=1 Tax=Meganyctiphanes norvegica TaxID=48144 RepID=A0AAV2SN90_MEGNR
MEVLMILMSGFSLSLSLDANGFHRVPDYEPVQDLFKQRVTAGESLSTNPLVSADKFPNLIEGLRAGVQAAVGASQLGVVSNVGANLRELTEPIGACLYWCRTNQGQVYCCESDTQNPNVPIPKPGKCPAECPNEVDQGGDGPSCRLDVECSGGQKCCINPCDVQTRVCRDPVPLEELKPENVDEELKPLTVDVRGITE